MLPLRRREGSNNCNNRPYVLNACIVSCCLLTVSFLDALGHGGPVTISPNTSHYDELAKVLINASTELGVTENVSYNSGDSQGLSLFTKKALS